MKTVRTILLVVLAVAGGLMMTKDIFDAVVGQRAEVRVECKHQMLLNLFVTGYDCSLQHIAGGALANACWRVQGACENGTMVNARACSTVAPGQTRAEFIPSREIANLSACDVVRSLWVDDITVTAEALAVTDRNTNQPGEGG